ncbi:MAG TPA: GlsB/YeaQ/YmgE family stress response membrane protein [Anaeromyxobacter sp.]
MSGSNDVGFQTSGFIGSLLGAIVLLLIAGLVTSPRRRTA